MGPPIPQPPEPTPTPPPPPPPPCSDCCDGLPFSFAARVVSSYPPYIGVWEGTITRNPVNHCAFSGVLDGPYWPLHFSAGFCDLPNNQLALTAVEFGGSCFSQEIGCLGTGMCTMWYGMVLLMVV